MKTGETDESLPGQGYIFTTTKAGQSGVQTRDYISSYSLISCQGLSLVKSNPEPTSGQNQLPGPQTSKSIKQTGKRDRKTPTNPQRRQKLFVCPGLTPRNGFLISFNYFQVFELLFQVVLLSTVWEKAAIHRNDSKGLIRTNSNRQQTHPVYWQANMENRASWRSNLVAYWNQSNSFVPFPCFCQDGLRVQHLK